MRLPRRKTLDERLKAALVKSIERDHGPSWMRGVPPLRVWSISTHYSDDGLHVTVDLRRA